MGWMKTLVAVGWYSYSLPTVSYSSLVQYRHLVMTFLTNVFRSSGLSTRCGGVRKRPCAKHN